MLVARFFTPRSVFLVVAPRDARLPLTAAGYVERVWCVEPPPALASAARRPVNLRLLNAAGLAALPPASADVALAEDAACVPAVARVLAPGGVLVLAGAAADASMLREAGFRRVAWYAGGLRVPAALARRVRSPALVGWKPSEPGKTACLVRNAS